MHLRLGKAGPVESKLPGGRGWKLVHRLFATALTLLLMLISARLGGEPVPATQPPAPTTPAAPPAVPAEYAKMYQSLSAALDLWQQTLDRQPPVANAQSIFGAHVLAANGNRGAQLLQPMTLPMVDLTLDRLKQLGVGGVTISISFPLLNEDQPQSADYLRFYETVGEHVRARGLYFTVEQHIAFSDTPFSTVKFDYRQLPFADFITAFHHMARLIIEHVKPDALTLLSEPDTFVKLTGYQQARDPAGAARMIERVVQGLDRSHTKIGAGCGAWLRNAPEFDRAFAAGPVDYLSLHIYPIGPGVFTLCQQIADIARAAGKPVILDEAWLSKTEARTQVADFNQMADIFGRDAFSFWAPLDAKFFANVAHFARVNGVAYVAPFWTTYFWGNVDYAPDTQGLPFDQLRRRANRAATAALQAGTFTPTGQAWGDTIR
jgi:hypothetical protein